MLLLLLLLFEYHSKLRKYCNFGRNIFDVRGTSFQRNKLRKMMARRSTQRVQEIPDKRIEISARMLHFYGTFQPARALPRRREFVSRQFSFVVAALLHAAGKITRFADSLVTHAENTREISTFAASRAANFNVKFNELV